MTAKSAVKAPMKQAAAKKSQAFVDKSKPSDIRQSNIAAAKGKKRREKFCAILMKLREIGSIKGVIWLIWGQICYLKNIQEPNKAQCIYNFTSEKHLGVNENNRELNFFH